MGYLRERNELAKELKDFRKKYLQFTKEISPKDWNISGQHMVEINNMISDIRKLKKLSPQERETPMVQKYLNIN